MTMTTTEEPTKPGTTTPSKYIVFTMRVGKGLETVILPICIMNLVTINYEVFQEHGGNQ